MTSKEKIVLVIKESIRLGKDENFVYDVMLEKHKEIWNIKKLQTTMDEKIALFNNLDENSELFKNIYGTAKLALTKIKDNEGYNFYCADLILKINMLEEVFKGKLKSIGTRIIDQVEKPKPIVEAKTIQESDEDENNDESDIFDGVELMKSMELPSGKYLRENVTGEKFKNAVMKKHEIKTSLQQSQL